MIQTIAPIPKAAPTRAAGDAQRQFLDRLGRRANATI